MSKRLLGNRFVRVFLNILLKLNFANHRVKILQRLGAKIGDKCRLISYDFGTEPYLIRIGNNVTITDGVKFITHDGGVHILREEDEKFDVFGRIEISDNCFIGVNSVILPGVKIGKNTIVAAGSIVTKSFAGDVVIGGNPAKMICSISEYREKNSQYNMRTKGLSALEKEQVILKNQHMLIQK